MEKQKMQNSQHNTGEEEQRERIDIPPDFNTYYKATVLKKV